ncbi:hypothetical protein [Streptomyces odonnellii]|uniref:hypothetical protein n=1 Tax=Streptomyces odonnellii TaxID=1417980 RepID=UPI0012FEB2AA|nr:hypothetical protein [Streptomyces odonnellii]
MTVRGTRRSVRYGRLGPGPGRVRRQRLLAAVCLGGLLALTACGGGGGASDEPSDSGFTATAEPTPTETTAEPTPSETETSEPVEEPTETATDDTGSGDDSGSDDYSSDGSGSDSGSGDDVSSGVPRGQWSGTARISVDFSDPGCGETSESYELPATLIITDPVGGEDNSFNLTWASDSQTPAGAFGVSSALDATDTLDGEAVSVNYWTLSEDGSGGISGDLTDPGNSEALALNLLFVPKPILPCSQYMVFPYGMATGTTLEGTVSEDSASLTLSGTSLDGTRSFRVEWS